MRGILCLILIVLVLALVGWISFNRDPSRPGVNLETQKMKDDTKRAMDNGADLLKKAENSIDSSKRPDEPKQPVEEPAPAGTNETGR